uniref:Pleurin1 n=1 Tax=Deroceras reticulatum TaxID=145610 RepID=A0A1X9WEF5_DERRE|nr:pleurin1 [Deroceras reticulatum]
MNYQNHSLILLVLISSACAVFYTKSDDNDYPRIGRRSFYTRGSDTHYPRIGRRDATSAQVLIPGLDFADLSTLHKRGIFTQSAHGSYPRVGRGSEEASSGEDSLCDQKISLLERLTGLKEEIDEEDGNKEGNSGSDEFRNLFSPLDATFRKFDVDKDGKLSKKEFLSGFNTVRQHGSGC